MSTQKSSRELMNAFLQICGPDPIKINLKELFSLNDYE
jgi:hypothetical protein